MSLVPFSQVLCAESPPASQAFNSPGGGAPRSPRCTYPLISALEGNILGVCSITFPWSSGRPWVPRVRLAPLPGPLRVQFAGDEGQVEGRVRVGRRPFSLLQAGCGGPGSVAPARGMWEEVVGFLFVFHIMGC